MTDFIRNEYRYEIKAPVQKSQHVEFERWLKESIIPVKEVFPERTVHSVYFDTPSLDDYQENVAGISRRKKTRLRWYDETISELVLETKIKENKVCNKRVQRLPDSNIANPLSTQELSDFIRNLMIMPIRLPVLHVSYSRKYFEISQGVRMTLDSNITYQRLFPTESQDFKRSLVDHVIEFKFPVGLKRDVAGLLAGMPCRVFRHSKYVIGVDMVCNL